MQQKAEQWWGIAGHLQIVIAVCNIGGDHGKSTCTLVASKGVHAIGAVELSACGKQQMSGLSLAPDFDNSGPLSRGHAHAREAAAVALCEHCMSDCCTPLLTSNMTPLIASNIGLLLSSPPYVLSCCSVSLFGGTTCRHTSSRFSSGQHSLQRTADLHDVPCQLQDQMQNHACAPFQPQGIWP